MSGAAFNALIGHGHHSHHQHQHGSVSTPSSSHGSAAPPVVLGNGSHSAGVVGSISFTNASGNPQQSTSMDVNLQLPFSPTPPLQRRLAKSFSVAPTSTQQKGAKRFYTLDFVKLSFL